MSEIKTIPAGQVVDLLHREGAIDWRTIDPETIRGEGVPVEELRYYRERLEDLLKDGEGRYVLIVGREIISLFEGLDEAAKYAWENYGLRPVLIKKVVAVEPAHTLGGASAAVPAIDRAID